MPSRHVSHAMHGAPGLAMTCQRRESTPHQSQRRKGEPRSFVILAPLASTNPPFGGRVQVAGCAG